MRIVAFAMGNALRADDGAGRAMARGLESLLPGVEVVEVQQQMVQILQAQQQVVVGMELKVATV